MSPSRQPRRPFALIAIALFQLLKGAFMMIVSLMLVFDPRDLPYSGVLSQLLFIAAHGREVSGALVPLLGAYIMVVGVRLLALRASTRRNLAISSGLTIILSLQRLGVFGDGPTLPTVERQSLYMLILGDALVFIYLRFHPEILRAFGETK